MQTDGTNLLGMPDVGFLESALVERLKSATLMLYLLHSSMA